MTEKHDQPFLTPKHMASVARSMLDGTCYPQHEARILLLKIHMYIVQPDTFDLSMKRMQC